MIMGVSSQCGTLMEREKLEEYQKTSLEMGERSSVIPLHTVLCGWVVHSLDARGTAMEM